MARGIIGVYIMGNERPTLYVGMTNNLPRRILEHKGGKLSGFTKKYNLEKCPYYEVCETVPQAIIREKQLKDLDRSEKLELIQERNSLFSDLSKEVLLG